MSNGYSPGLYRAQGGNKMIAKNGTGVIQLGEAVDTAAIFMGGGTSASTVSTATADLNFMGFWLDTTATSGDSRGLYLRLYFSGTGVSGEAARIFGTVNNKTVATGGTVNGAHVSLSVTGASGAISGAGNALRATLGLGASTNSGGTVAALQLDSDFDATATIPALAACMRVTNSNTGKWPYFANIPAASNSTIFATHTTQAMSHSIRIVDAAGTPYYIMCTNAATNRGGGS